MTTRNRFKAILTIAAVAMAILALTTTSANAALVDGLVEYWELDGDYSAKVDPSHGGTLTTTGSGSGAFVSGKFGKGIDLESSVGNQAYVVIGGAENDFDFAGGSMSFSAWYTTESLYTNYQCLLGKGENAAWRVARVTNSGTNIKLSVAGAIGNGQIALQDGSWHHVVGTYDANTGTTLYIDGSLVGSTTAAYNLQNVVTPMQIGGNPQAAGRAWDGNFDDVGVWNRVLTADEVSSIWNYGAGASIGSLTGPGDPNAPEVDAGADVITWSGEPVTMDPNVVNNDTTEPQGILTYLWTAEPNGIGDPNLDVVITGADQEDASVTITKTAHTGDATVVTMTLAVTLEGKDPVTDTMTIDVYDDACLAAIDLGLAVIDPTDLDENCITNFEDIAVMATTWLVDYTLTEPVAKP